MPKYSKWIRDSCQSTIYPFGKNNFLKLFLADESKFAFPSLKPLYSIMSLNRNIEILSLYARQRKFRNFMERSLLEYPAYAIALKDDHNNIFLFRRKKALDSILWGSDFKSPMLRILDIAQSENKSINITIATHDLPDELFKKIENWDKATRKDIEPLFIKAEFEEILKTEKYEIDMLRILKKYGINSITDNEIMLLKKIRENPKKIDIYDAIKLIDEKTA